ncbi:phosphocholine-specific phospholipase C [Streptomyces sp. NPDC051976]|uniref:phosphocholine-specific phospholipase C n=1 Tax=Streptomyces sp. NPDC051976 TaxID=3154947 RepID=UPI003446A7D6
MSELSRRKFIALSASAAVTGSVGGVVAATGTSQAAGTTGTLADARHIVVLMQENRSFDHYFGMLKGVRGFSDRATIMQQNSTGPSTRTVFDQPTSTGHQLPWQLSATSSGGTNSALLAQYDADLPHAWADQHQAWSGGRLDAWVAAKGVGSLGYLTRADIPFHYALADTWTVCDAYHCSILSATGPNRTYHWSGRTSADAKDGGDELGKNLSWQTIAEGLENAGVSWKVYQSTDNFGDNALEYFANFANAPAGSALAVKGKSTVPRGTTKPGDTADDIADALAADVKAGKLPQVSWLVPNQAYSEHPAATPGNGAYFVHRVINALAADPDTFNSTILIINYDENDGFFDHVPPPVPPSSETDEWFGSEHIGLGFRVPLIAVSPWSRGGWVSSETFDHTSVLRFVEQWTAAIGKPVSAPNISDWRRSVCGDLTSLFDFANPVYGLPTTLPATPQTAAKPGGSLSPGTNSLPTQESGTRPARPLPYQPDANLAAFDPASGSTLVAWIDMRNTGSSALCLSSYANAHRSGGPWHYTLDGDGGTDRDYFYVGSGFGEGAYDLSVVGPNRFLRRFTGDATKPGMDLLVTTSYVTAPETGKLAIQFTLANNSPAETTFTITNNNTAYRSDGPWHYTVAAAETATDHFNAVHYSNGWYDLTVTADSDTTWSQRFTGHLETGQNSVSG